MPDEAQSSDESRTLAGMTYRTLPIADRKDCEDQSLAMLVNLSRPSPAPAVQRHRYVPCSVRASMVAPKPPVAKPFDAERNWSDVWHTVERSERSDTYLVTPLLNRACAGPLC